MYESEFLIPNNTKEVLSIWIEPWAFSWDVPAGSICKFSANSEIQGEFECVEEDGKLEVYGWCGSNLKIFIDDKLEWDNGDLRVPGLPFGMSTRSFVELVFSEHPEAQMPKPQKWWKFW